jgi:hypothetical protein
MTDQEYRKESRINTHIALEICIEGDMHSYCGYIENLTREGMGVISLDQLETGAKVTLSFYMAGITGKISPQATLIHVEKGIYNLYNYGFKFENLNEKENKAIEQYMRENSLTWIA